MSEGPVGDEKARPLDRYWTKGKGLARWAISAHPYTTLVRELQSEKVPEKYVHGLAAKYYHAVFRVWPGDHSGGKKHDRKPN
ncbi:hypothetical protein [Prescottella equi]|uniref:hypothetical protein n=1 Tax=Rhodococcus hoagii TaxID=43767 RepID=UPI000D0F7E80|nr:hypothetical protein [Prescottella equi]AVP71232.1 hypothetical protein C7H75_24375 [Prescottella equi]MBM4469923.1 hypothetical protein [Prescottella equi]NKZ84528.1 hypothetical protein [Prescottella equi]